MIRYSLIPFLFLLFFTKLTGQSSREIGIGYFGHTLSHPGVVLDYGLETRHSEKAAFLLRFDLGFYTHPRNQTGIFADVNAGLRFYFKSGLFLEEGIGIGILQTILRAEGGIYEVDDNGQVREVSGFNQPDLMPSLSLGIGYDLTKKQEKKTLIWLRPKVFWQTPQKGSSVHHFAIQVGCSRSF